MKFELSKSELGFISDLIAGATTPRALLNIGNFVGHVSEHVLAYETQLRELSEAQKLDIETLAKEYFEQTEDGQPKTREVEKEDANGDMKKVQEWILIEGKDRAEFERLYQEKTKNAMDARQEAGNQRVSLEVEDSVVKKAINSILDETRIALFTKNLGIDAQVEQANRMGQQSAKKEEFTGALYNILVTLDKLQA